MCFLSTKIFESGDKIDNVVVEEHNFGLTYRRSHPVNGLGNADFEEAE